MVISVGSAFSLVMYGALVAAANLTYSTFWLTIRGAGGRLLFNQSVEEHRWPTP
jgi:hypothetical protein